MISRGWRLERRGVALPLTLIVLTVLMLLTGTALMLARLESRSAGETLAATQATAAAEAGFEIAAADWPVEAWDTLPPGVTVASAAGAWAASSMSIRSLTLAARSTCRPQSAKFAMLAEVNSRGPH